MCVCVCELWERQRKNDEKTRKESAGLGGFLYTSPGWQSRVLVLA